MSAQQTSAHGAPASRTSSIAASAGLGVLAAAIGYLVTYVLIASEVGTRAWSPTEEWKEIAWYFYSAHLVEIEASTTIGDWGGSWLSGNLIANSDSAAATGLYVIPPLMLVIAGALLAYHLRASDLGSAVFVGAPVTIGYFVVMAAGSVVSGDSFGMNTSMGPDVAQSLLLAGLLYPLVFATAGAILVAVIRS